MDQKAWLLLEQLYVSTQAQDARVSAFDKAVLNSNTLPAAVTLAFL